MISNYRNDKGVPYSQTYFKYGQEEINNLACKLNEVIDIINDFENGLEGIRGELSEIKMKIDNKDIELEEIKKLLRFAKEVKK